MSQDKLVIKNTDSLKKFLEEAALLEKIKKPIPKQQKVKENSNLLLAALQDKILIVFEQLLKQEKFAEARGIDPKIWMDAVMLEAYNSSLDITESMETILAKEIAKAVSVTRKNLQENIKNLTSSS